MMEFFISYTEANIFCIVIFGLMLLHDMFNVDRQEKQIKFDHALIAFMLYFAVDCFWAAATAGLIPKNNYTVVLVDFLICALMAMITYTWLDYVMAVEQVPNRNKPINRFAILFPFLVSMLSMLITYLVSPQTLVDENLELKPIYNLFLVTVPYIYIIAIIIYGIKRAREEENAAEKRKFILISFFPLLLIGGGILQMLFFPDRPIYCYLSTILMLVFYIQMMERQISLDPLTSLNNRGQLLRYVSQPSNIHQEDRKTFVYMIDINDFKSINDTYGHAEGDKALIIIADSLKKAISSLSMPIFIGRYGGDEFILIAHPRQEAELDNLAQDIRTQIKAECEAKGASYDLTVGIGRDEIQDENDTFQKCMQRADRKLYLDKEQSKKQTF